MKNILQEWLVFGFSDLPYVETQYLQFLEDPARVEESWRHFFEGWVSAQSLGGDGLDVAAEQLVDAYRRYGHLKARFNCFAEEERAVPELDYRTYGVQEGDLGKVVNTAGFLKEESVPFSVLLGELQKTYAGQIGIEYMGCCNRELEKWIQDRVEPGCAVTFSAGEKRKIFDELNKAELFEVFLHTKYVGQKRFSLEGAETLIPMLQAALEAEAGISEVVIGMAHRGRLNVLANVLGKSYASIFHEFEDFYTPDIAEGTGDVKYHKGFAAQVATAKGKVLDVIIAPNPSHLEAVDPVLEGQARGRQMEKGKGAVLPILIHGDASLAGQGVVYETLQLSKLKGYETGGTVHIVINNQIGFTTLPQDGRSTRYCTDIAKSFGAPVFHVNAEDPEGSVYATLLALQIRQRFGLDVFIDLTCYRKYGHNEGDEPAFTQPVQHLLIREKKTIRALYMEHLIATGVMTPEMSRQEEQAFKEKLQEALARVKTTAPPQAFPPAEQGRSLPTAVSEEKLKSFAAAFCAIPANFNIHPKVRKLQEERLASLNTTIDWGMAEHLAYASLLADAVPIRISGQDSRRGTFSHRHAMWVDQKNGERYYPLSHLKTNKALFDIYNSPLSEFAVLGFEFGYSLARPETLVIWEAQYGDFANGAQVIIDQFIATAQQKWGFTSNLVLFLPHGYEGQGPEHSSARLERFLQLSADRDWTVANPSSPAQMFHLLRRQAQQTPKRPLVLMTPKALLRHPQAVSPLADLSAGSFQEVIADAAVKNPRRVIFCSGRVYYTLLAARKNEPVALIRIEELYPLCTQKIAAVVQENISAADWCWVQEESQNMGAWSYMVETLAPLLPRPLRYIGREASSSPAAGSHALHEAQLKKFTEEAFQ